ncbi:MAG: hypothetical protein H5U40_14240, partial [Polyangiaceae bacterium]|nr:hypothetical protein [Polyangiaceae bacterium]
ESREVVIATEPAEGEAPSPVAPVSAATRRPPRRARIAFGVRRQVTLVGAALGGIALVAALSLLGASRIGADDEPSPSTPSASGPSLVAATASSSVPTPSTPPSSATSEAVESATPLAPLDPYSTESAGRLRISVVPWGRVWVNGRLIGRAPRVVAAADGEHLVQVGYHSPTKARKVRVTDARTVQVAFTLD